MIDKIKSILSQGEGLKIEFKAAQNGIPKNVYETICAFSNTQGGEILLGVGDNGQVLGIDKTNVSRMLKDFANTINNTSQFRPPLYLSVEQIEFEDKLILYVLVPTSSDVHFCCNKIYIRNADGDMDITNQSNLVAQLYANKDKSYSENEIYPGLTLSDFRTDLIDRCRKMAVGRQANHPWKYMTDEQLLRSAGLYKKDFCSQKEGYTLACAVLFGHDDVIQSILPHYKTDLILRINDTDRYDDRDDVRTNLIESYDRIMAFVEKHLPTPFYLEKDIRLDLRSILFREIAVNLLMHREFTSHYPAKLVIERERIYTENGNKPYVCGNINPDTSVPFPKNPTIARFFKEIGWAEELGSGVRKMAQYAKAYAGNIPVLTDGNVFKLDWKIDLFQGVNNQPKEQVGDQVSDQPSYQVSDQARTVLQFCAEPKALIEIMRMVRLKSRVYFMNHVIKPLIEKKLIEMVYPDKPNHPNQKYVTSKGRK